MVHSETDGATDLVELPVTQFLEILANGSAAPGGGAAVALVGALGAALAGMVAGLTLGRKRYAAVQAEMETCAAQARALRGRLAKLVDADTIAYARVSAAYSLPKDTESRQAGRVETIQHALAGALDVQMDVAATCVDLLELLRQVAAHGNRNAAVDAAVAALLAHSALQGAARNVRANLAGLHDSAIVQEARARIGELVADGEHAYIAALAAAGTGG